MVLLDNHAVDKNTLLFAKSKWHLSRCRILFLLAFLCIVSISKGVVAQSEVLKSEKIKQAEKAVRIQNFELALTLYKEAANDGDAEAQYQLGTIYSLGVVTNTDMQLAKLWFLKAADQGHLAASYQLALNEIKDSDGANGLTKLYELAGQGYVPARRYLDQLGNPEISEGARIDDVGVWFGAARIDALSDMKIMVQSGHPIDDQNTSGQTALFIAIDSKSKEVVDWLLKKSASVNHRDYFGNSPLFVAIKSGELDVVKKLISSGANLNQALPNGDQALHYSIRLNEKSISEFLINRGAPLNTVNKDGWSALDLAKYSEHQALTKTLLAKGAREGHSWTTRKSSRSDLSASQFLAANQNSLVDINEVAKIVLSENVSLAKKILSRQPELIDQRFGDGSNLLYLAISEESPEMASLLISLNADVNQIAFNDLRPIHIAARNGNAALLKLLLKNGANLLSETDEGVDAIEWAIQEKHEKVAEQLIKIALKSTAAQPSSKKIDRYILRSAQANLSRISPLLTSVATKLVDDQLGRNALWYAAQHGNLKAIEGLKALNDKSPNIDIHGKSAFIAAVENSCLDCAEALYSEELLNFPTKTGNTALMSAASANNSAMCSWLIDKQADIEIRNKNGYTALILAAEAEAFDAVKVLVAAGSKIARKNKLGFSALDIAKRKNEEMYLYLKDRSVLGIF